MTQQQEAGPDKAAPGPAETALALGQMLLGQDEFAAAAESFRMAARGGSPVALTMLGRMHERGWGRPADAATAALWFRRAAAAGEPWAMFNLADLYLAGRGVAQDLAAARDLYAAAAQRGHHLALNMLGMLAESGQGPDFSATADSYFRAGAEAGDPWAMCNLARRLLQRQGVCQEVLTWLDRAIAQGFPACWQAIATALEGQTDAALCHRCAEARARVRAARDLRLLASGHDTERSAAC